MAVKIPDKSYFKIGEVSKIVGVEPYNIRYWESQFRALRPSKTKSNQRLYRRKDIELLLKIKSLLYEEGYTIAGAKKQLKGPMDGGQSASASANGVEGGMAGEERRAYADSLAKSQAEITEMRARVRTLTEDLARTRQDCTEKLELAEAEHQKMVHRVKTTEARAAALDKRETDLAQLSDKLSEAELERATLADELDAAQAEIARLKTALRDETERRTRRERALENLKGKDRLLIEKLRGELGALLRKTRQSSIS